MPATYVEVVDCFEQRLASLLVRVRIDVWLLTAQGLRRKQVGEGGEGSKYDFVQTYAALEDGDVALDGAERSFPPFET